MTPPFRSRSSVVRRTSSRRIVGPLLAGACLLGCGGDGGAPALRVGPVAYSESDLLGLSPTLQNRLAEITAFAFAFATDSADALGEPWVERMESDLLIRQWVAEEILLDREVSEDQLAGQYSLNPRPELVVRHIVFLADRSAAPAARDSARASAEAALRRAQAGEAFGPLAAELSEEPGAAERGGLLEPGRSGSWVPEFWDAATRLEVGETSPVVETQYGFHVLRLDERRTVPFEEVRDEIVLEVAALIENLGGAVAGRVRALADSFAVAVDVREAIRGNAGSVAPEGSTPVATGTGEAFSLEDLLRYLASLDQRAWESALADPASFDRFLRESAASKILTERAVTSGIRLSDSQGARIRNDWRTVALQASFPLELPTDPDPELLAAASLNALSISTQNARIARDLLVQRGPLLRYFLPVERAGDTDRAETGPTGDP